MRKRLGINDLLNLKNQESFDKALAYTNTTVNENAHEDYANYLYKTDDMTKEGIFFRIREPKIVIEGNHGWKELFARSYSGGLSFTDMDTDITNPHQNLPKDSISSLNAVTSVLDFFFRGN